MTEPHRITGEMDAISIAKEVTGFGGLERVIASAERVTVIADDTPFLAKQLIGTGAWRVQFDNLSLKLKSAIPGFEDPYLRRFIVMIQEDSGRLWSVKAFSDEKDPDLKAEPSAEEAEAQLRPEGEVYEGLAATSPGITFLDALDVILQRGNGSPFLAKEIHAVYVLESIRAAAPLPVWSITLRGIPPIPVTGRYAGTVPIWQRNRMRNVVDAKAGKLMFATNSPQPH